MKVLQIGKYYPPHKGGMETVLAGIAAGLRARGDDVDVLVAADGRATRREAIAPDAPGRGRLVRCGSWGAVASQPLTPSLPGELRRQLREGPDVLTLHWPNPLAAAALLASGGALDDRTRVTVWYHADITRQRLGGRLVQPVLRRLLERADGIAVSTASLSDQSPALAPHGGRVRVIPFGIDVDAWDLPTRPGEGPLLFVGRLVYYKGLEVLLEAMTRLPRARLAIVGDGPLRGKLARRIRGDGLEGRVALLGELDDDTLREAMSGAAALVLPSLRRSETFGLVQLEAMAAGLPVVATQLPTGVAEVTVDGGTGLLAAPGDATALAAALSGLLDDPERAAALGAAGRRRVRERFASAGMVEALAGWYAELANGGRRRWASGS